jgi:hypothetical protein
MPVDSLIRLRTSGCTSSLTISNSAASTRRHAGGSASAIWTASMFPRTSGSMRSLTRRRREQAGLGRGATASAERRISGDARRHGWATSISRQPPAMATTSTGRFRTQTLRLTTPASKSLSAWRARSRIALLIRTENTFPLSSFAAWTTSSRPARKSLPSPICPTVRRS